MAGAKGNKKAEAVTKGKLKDAAPKEEPKKVAAPEKKGVAPKGKQAGK